MKEAKVKGLVIRTVDLKEADRLLTVYTEELGVIVVMAKGAKKINSRNLAATSHLAYSSFVLSGRGEQYWLKESELIEGFFGIRGSLEGLALSAYISEILCDVATAEADKELLRLCLNTLYAISEGKHPIDKIKAAFEIRAMAILGYTPDVLECSVCGEKHGEFYFDIMRGALICYRCREKQSEVRLENENPRESRPVCIVSEGAKIALGYCVYSPLERLFSFKIPEEETAMLCRVAEEYLTNQLERTFKTLEFYKEVKR